MVATILAVVVVEDLKMKEAVEGHLLSQSLKCPVPLELIHSSRQHENYGPYFVIQNHPDEWAM